jgi:hypothetical protein
LVSDRLRGPSSDRVRNGRIIEYWGEVDTVSSFAITGLGRYPKWYVNFMTRFAFVIAYLVSGPIPAAADNRGGEPATIVVHSDELELQALLWTPPGRGPFPAILFNHGSGHAWGVDSGGRRDQRHPELLGPLEGHDFIHLGVSLWEPDVLTFLQKNVKERCAATRDAAD